MNYKHVAIAGIHTGIGKTIVSAVLAEALIADYWKPVQAGLDETDSDTIRNLIVGGDTRVHPEEFRLTQPLSPHAAAAIDGVTVDYTKFRFPETNKLLLVETAGGLLSPINHEATMADFIQHFDLPVILVVKHYLGSINHTLLCCECLKQRNIPTIGIVISGATNPMSEQFITQYSKFPLIATVPHFENLSKKSISELSASLKDKISSYFYE